MPTEVKMPKLGLTMEEGAVVEWLKAEGETVESGEPLFVLETDKITFEVEAPQRGVLGQILVAPGTTVPTGTAVGLILQEDEQLTVTADRAAEDTRAQRPPHKIKATPVARRLAQATDLDLIIVATDTPDYISPATASVVQDALGAVHAGTYDINCA